MRKISWNQLDEESITKVLNEKYDIKGSASSSLTNANLYTDTKVTAAKPNFTEITIAIADWSSDSLTAVVTFKDGLINANTLIKAGPSISDRVAYAKYGVECIDQSTNTLTFSCKKVPEVPLKCYIEFTNQYTTITQ